MKFMLTVILILFSWLVSNAQERREQGNLIIEGIPEIPKAIVERLDQYQNVRSATFEDWEPSGNGMLISTRFANTNQIHHLSGPGMYRKQLTFFTEPITAAEYSAAHPDGFLFPMDEGGGEFDQLYWFDLKKGTSHLLTDGGKSVNGAVLFSPSGSLVAYHSTKRNGKDFDLYVMNPVDPKSARMIKEVKGSWRPLDWSEDESRILVTEYISANESYLFEMDSTAGKLSPVNAAFRKIISYETAVYARNGKDIFYIADEDNEFYRLFKWNGDTKTKEVVVDLGWDIELVSISMDGKWIAFTANEGGVSSLYLGSVDNPKEASKVKLPPGVISKIKFDRQSKRLALNLSSARSPSDVFSVDVESRNVERWTFSEIGGIDPSTFVEPQLIHFPTFDSVDGKPRSIPAFYYKPQETSGKRLPVIINIHGGPESQARASFNSTFQYWVNELGLAVLVPNVRGSSGYGKSYLMLDNGRKREDSVKDIGALLDWIEKQPELDSKRIAVNGGSYGGYMVLASLFHYGQRIHCGIDTVGISHFGTFLKSTESYRRDLRRAEYGDERDPEMIKFFDSIAPLNNAAKIKSPLFVIQGANDPRVPISESEQIVKTVRGQGNTVWYLIAKDEGHGFAKKGNRDYQQAAMSLFLQEFLLKEGR